MITEWIWIVLTIKEMFSPIFRVKSIGEKPGSGTTRSKQAGQNETAELMVRNQQSAHRMQK